MTDSIPEGKPRAPSSWHDRWHQAKTWVVAAASIGAVLSGLVGYYTTYRTVAGERAPSATAQKPLPTIDADPSVAVLPLVNLSADPDQEYFSDGLTEELQNLLGKVPKLRVIARTSSFAFKRTQEPIEAIARKLNVAAIVEGSVQRSADKLRVKIQLVRASDSSQLWAETFDRPMGDVFKVQDEIARAVIERMKVVLAGAAPKSQPTDPAAFQLVLQAAAASGEFTTEGRARAVSLAKQALRIDPREPRARNLLASVYINQANYAELTLAAGYALARETAHQQLAEYPDDATAHSLLGRVALEIDGDLTLAAREMSLALQGQNNSTPRVRIYAGFLLLALGRLEEAVAVLEPLRAIDPANSAVFEWLSAVQAARGDWDKAIDSARTMLALRPGSRSRYVLGTALLGKGQAAAALATVNTEPVLTWRLNGIALAAFATGARREADEALARLVREFETEAAYNIAEIHAFRGEADSAFDWLGKAVKYHDSGLAAVTTSPFMRSLRGDKRWLPFLRSIGRTPEQLSAIEFKVSAGR
jgi:TolB-like protein/Flp pilus assembly protein TadD